MPGTPPTSPRYGFPRPADGDTASFSSQLTAIADVLDQYAAHLGKGEGYLPGDLIQSHAATRAGAVLCDGTAYTLSSHAEMNALAAACPGLVSGGVLTVPDYRGRTMIGAGTGSGLSARTVGQTGGEENHALTGGENGPHSHSLGAQVPYFVSGVFQNKNVAGSNEGIVPSAGAGSWGLISATGSNGSGTAHNNMQPYGVANIFIKL